MPPSDEAAALAVRRCHLVLHYAAIKEDEAPGLWQNLQLGVVYPCA